MSWSSSPLNSEKVDKAGSERSLSAADKSSRLAGRACFPLVCLVVAPFVVLAFPLVNLARGRVAVDLVTMSPRSGMSRMSPVIKTSGGGSRVHLLEAVVFWAIVAVGTFGW
jgi:hypothetical protein